MIGKIIAGAMAGSVLIAGMVYWGTYNGFQKKDELINADERKIASCYKKRSDLFSNLEATVERVAKQEKDIVVGNAEARSKAGSVRLPDNATPEQIKAFMEAQQGMGSVMTRLLAVAESVPSLGTNINFLKMQKDLKDIETQCSILRNHYIQHVAAYNASIRSFPSNLVASYHDIKKREQIKFDDEVKIKTSPRVFGAK
jgi:LemA protein